MILVLSSTLIAMQLVAFAFPTPGLDATAALTSVQPTCDNISACRTTVSLLWSCLSTVFLCTWVAVHPNVPSSHKTSWNLENIFESRTRWGLLGLMLAAPEIVVAIAYNEWTEACQRTAQLSSTLFHHYIHNVMIRGFRTVPRDPMDRDTWDDDGDERIRSGERR